MASYDSNRSGHLHPQYQQPQPPYPTTPGGPSSQPQTYFPPIPEQQLVYPTSPTHQLSQPFYSTSPSSPRGYMPQPSSSTHRRTSSTSSYNSQRPPMPMPIPIPSRCAHEQYQHQYAASYPQQPASYPPAQQQPAYAHEGEDRHGGEDKFYGGLDPKTEREYERRYAKDKAAERRPTLGGSLLSMVGKVGRAFDSRR